MRERTLSRTLLLARIKSKVSKFNSSENLKNMSRENASFHETEDCSNRFIQWLATIKMREIIIFGACKTSCFISAIWPSTKA